jgi:hypothetical protein
MPHSYTNPDPNAPFKGFQVGGGFAKGKRPPECGNPRTGNRTGWSRLEVRESRNCPSCFREATRPGRALGNGCRQRLGRYGDPQATGAFPIKWVARDVAEALRLIKAIRKLPADHQARLQLDHAERYLTVQMDNCRGYELRGYRPGMSQTLRQKRRWGNLLAAGIKPERILALVAGMFTARDNFEAFWLSDRHWHHQLGSAVCRLATLPKSFCNPPFKDEGVLGGVAVPIGEQLVDRVGVFCGGVSLALQTGRTFGAIPALTAGLPPPAKSTCLKAIQRKQWKPRYE